MAEDEKKTHIFHHNPINILTYRSEMWISDPKQAMQILKTQAIYNTTRSLHLPSLLQPRDTYRLYWAHRACLLPE